MLVSASSRDRDEGGLILGDLQLLKQAVLQSAEARSAVLLQSQDSHIGGSFLRFAEDIRCGYIPDCRCAAIFVSHGTLVK